MPYQNNKSTFLYGWDELLQKRGSFQQQKHEVDRAS